MDKPHLTYADAARAELLRDVTAYAESHGLRDASLIRQFGAYLRDQRSRCSPDGPSQDRRS